MAHFNHVGSIQYLTPLHFKDFLKTSLKRYNLYIIMYKDKNLFFFPSPGFPVSSKITLNVGAGSCSESWTKVIREDRDEILLLLEYKEIISSPKLESGL